MVGLREEDHLGDQKVDGAILTLEWPN